jgi:hypothetical protein
MKRSLPTLVAFLLLAAAGQVSAQSPAPQPQPPATPASQPPERAAGERPLNLNLKLDDASRHRIMSGATEERPSGTALPSLGGDARAVELKAPPESVFPKESNSKIPAPY